MSRRKICIVTGTRAEYGLLYWLMKAIQSDPDLELQILVTGAHLSPEFGLTYKEIENDGFLIGAKVEMLLSSDTPVGVAKSIGLGIMGIAEALERLEPDILVLLGDRYEILAAAQAAMTARVPIAHIHGGELTEGLIDEAIRHSVTKMSHLHFVSTEIYRNRVIQLGEQPSRVFNVGAPGLDNIVRLKLLSKRELEQSINFSLGDRYLLVTYHPVTLNRKGPEQAMNELLSALDRYPHHRILFTKSNADPDGRIIGQMIEDYVLAHSDRACVVTSLGQIRYLSAVLHADAAVGNSSSGIIEVPFLKRPTVNIGLRQAGRESGPTVLHCQEEVNSICAAIDSVISESFCEVMNRADSVYGDGHTSERIKTILKDVSLADLIVKRFYDLEK